MSYDLREDVEVFISNAVASSRQVQLFEELFYGEVLEESQPVFPESMKIIHFSLCKAIIIGVCAFFDPARTGRSENLSLRYIENKYSDRITDEIRGMIVKADEVFLRLDFTKYRSKYFAHYDLKHFTKAESIHKEFFTEDIHELLVTLMRIGRELDNSSIDFTAEQLFRNSRLRAGDDGKSILKALRQSYLM